MLKQNIDFILKETCLEKDIINSLISKDYHVNSNFYDFSFSQVEDIANFFHLSIDDLNNGDFDLDLIKKRMISPSTAIPPEYLLAPGSYMETIKGMIDFLGRTYGERIRESVVRKMGLNDNALNNDQFMVNANACLKIGDILSDLNISKLEISNMAMQTNLSLKKRSGIYKHIKDCKDYLEVVSKMCELSSLYDKNFFYEIESHGNIFKIIASSNPEIHDVLKIKSITNEPFTYFRAFTVQNTSLMLTGRPMNLIDVTTEYKNGTQIVSYVFENENIPMLQ